MSEPSCRPIERSCLLIDRRLRNPPFPLRKLVHSNQTALGTLPERGQHSRFSDPSYSPLLLTSSTNPVGEVERERTWLVVARTAGSGLALKIVGTVTLPLFSTGYLESFQALKPPSSIRGVPIPAYSSIQATRAALIPNPDSYTIVLSSPLRPSRPSFDSRSL